MNVGRLLLKRSKWIRTGIFLPEVKRTTNALMSASENMMERIPMMKNKIPSIEKKSHGTNRNLFSAATAEK